mgnify:CR=1 FL=1
MKVTLNNTPATALILVKDATGLPFNQLLSEAMQLLQEKYKNEVKVYHEQNKQESS